MILPRGSALRWWDAQVVEQIIYMKSVNISIFNRYWIKFQVHLVIKRYLITILSVNTETNKTPFTLCDRGVNQTCRVVGFEIGKELRSVRLFSPLSLRSIQAFIS